MGVVLRSVVLLVLFGAVFVIQDRIDESFGQYRATEEILYIDSGSAMKSVLVGFDSIAADLYWLRTVQYFGGKRLDETNKNYDLLEPLLKITVELDPEFKIAYSYGATFMAEPFPMGAGMPSKAIEIIDKGIEQHPEHWRFFLDKGFIYFWFLNRPKEAAEVFLEGSKLPGAPYWMVATASRMLTTGGERETARHLWQMLYENAETNQQRENAVIHMRQLDALDETDRLKEVILDFRRSHGRYPEGWQELVAAGLLERVPVDPTGAVYVWNSRSQTVELGPDTQLPALPRK